MSVIRIPVVLVVLAVTIPCRAQDPEPDPTQETHVAPLEEGALDTKEDGWHWHLHTGATLNLNDNRSVVGQPDGTTATFGYNSEIFAELREDGHEWRNTFGSAVGVSYTPTVPELVKSRDLTALETIYLYHIVDWFGPFARFALATSLLNASDVRAAPTTYSILRQSGAVDTVVAERLLLTKSLRPTRLKESLGIFFQPVARESITAELRIGGGARNTFAAEQLAVNDDAATPAIDVVELTDVHQVGIEAVYEMFGAVLAKGITYKLVAEVLVPLWYTPDVDDRSRFELTNFSLTGKLSIHVVEWASIDYELGVEREPLLLDAWQIKNNLLVSFQVAAGSVEPKKAEE